MARAPARLRRQSAPAQDASDIRQKYRFDEYGHLHHATPRRYAVKRSASESPTDTGLADDTMTRRGAAGAFLAFGAAALAGCVTEDDPENTAAIEQALSGSDVVWVDTVLGAPPGSTRTGDLATNNATALGATVVIAKGCVTAGDGGGGLFYWDTTSRADNGGTVIVPGGGTGACWRRASRRIDVRYFGAVGDGVTDDRLAIQAAIDAADDAEPAHPSPPMTAPAPAAGETVHLGRGNFLVSQYSIPQGNQPWCLKVPARVSLVGAGRGATALYQVTSINTSVRLLHIEGNDVRIADLTLDGNKAHQSVNEHRHGIFANSANRLVVERVTSQNFTGDGFYLYQNANNSTFRDVIATGNNRNGLTMGSQVDGIVIAGSRFSGNAAQQVDSEAPGYTVNDVSITGCILDSAGSTGSYVLTISGSGTATRSRNWTVAGNVIHGGINVVWADDVTITGNTGTNPTTSRCVRVYRHCRNVTISGNNFRMTQTSTADVSTVEIVGTGTDQMPERVTVANNTFQVDNPTSWGIRAQGAVSVTLIGNTLRGSGQAGTDYAGIYLRTTNTAVPFRSAIVRANTISNFGAYGVRVNGNSTAQLLVVDISANVFDDDSTTATMTKGIHFDPLGVTAVQQQQIAGNTIIGGVTTMGP
jgi:hypothetical protein